MSTPRQLSGVLLLKHLKRTATPSGKAHYIYIYHHNSDNQEFLKTYGFLYPTYIHQLVENFDFLIRFFDLI